MIAALKGKAHAKQYEESRGDIGFEQRRIPEASERVEDVVLATFLNGYDFHMGRKFKIVDVNHD